MNNKVNHPVCPRCGSEELVRQDASDNVARCRHCKTLLRIEKGEGGGIMLREVATPPPPPQPPAASPPVPQHIDDDAPSGFFGTLWAIWETTWPILVGLLIAGPIGGFFLWRAGVFDEPVAVVQQADTPEGEADQGELDNAAAGDDAGTADETDANSDLPPTEDEETDIGKTERVLPDGIVRLDPDKIITDPAGGVLRVKDQLLVTLAEDKKANDIFEILDQAGIEAKVIGQIPRLSEFQIELDAESLDAALATLRKTTGVANACYNFVFEATRTFRDPVLVDGNRDNDWGLQAIEAPKAWRAATGKGVKIAIVDTGCKLDHPDIRGKVAFSFSCETRSALMQDPDNYDIRDEHGGFVLDKNGKRVQGYVASHGTHVAVTAAGAANDFGTIGIAPDAELLVLQALYHLGKGKIGAKWDANTDSISTHLAMSLAIDAGADVINMSFGPSYSDEKLAKLKSRGAALESERNFAKTKFYWSHETPLQKAHKHNVILVRAAGNDDLPADLDPLAYDPNVIMVAATDDAERRAIFDGGGASHFGPSVTVSAPGKNIYSGHSDPSTDYQTLSGTSMAAPHVTGVVALLRELKPDLTAEEAIRILRASGTPANHEPDKPIGPVVNAAKAIEMIKPDAFGEIPLAKWRMPTPGSDNVKQPPGPAEWMPDGKQIVTATRDGHVHVLAYDGKSKLSVARKTPFRTPLYGFRGMSISPDTASLALLTRFSYSDASHALQVWSLPDLQPRGEVPTIESWLAGFSLDSKQIATYGEVGVLGEVKSQVWMSWDAKSGKRKSAQKRTGDTFSVPLARNGYVVTMNQGKEWIVVDWSEAKKVGTLISEQQWGSLKSQLMNARVGLAKIGLHFGDTRIFQTEVVADDALSLAAFGNERTLFVVRLKDGSLVKSVDAGGKLIGIAMSPDGKRLLTGTMDGRLTLWDAKTLKQVVEYGDHPNVVYTIRFSPDSRRAVTTSVDAYLRVIATD